ETLVPVCDTWVTKVALEAIAAAFAYGACAMRFLLRTKPRHDVSSLVKTIALAEPILMGLGFGTGRVGMIETGKPRELGNMLRSLDVSESRVEAASFMASGGKRDLMRLALRELHRGAPTPVDVIALPAGAPFGAVDIKADGCTLCLA